MRKWRTKGGAIAASPACGELLDRVPTGGYATPAPCHLSPPQEPPCCRSATCSPRARKAPCSPARRSAVRASPGRGGCGGGVARGDVNFDTWHEELSERLDTAMRRLSPMLGSPE